MVHVIEFLCWACDWDLFILTINLQWNISDSCAMFLFPVRIFCPFCLVVASSLSNNAVQPALHNLPMDISELCVRPGIMYAYLAALGSFRNFSLVPLASVPDMSVGVLL